MEAQKISEVVARYRRLFAENGIPKRRADVKAKPVGPDALAHGHSMLDNIDGFVKAGRVGKAFRWLGFVQGILWCNGLYSLEALKSHNRT